MLFRLEAICLAGVLLVTIVAAVFGLHWAWKYYGLPEWPDRNAWIWIISRLMPEVFKK